MNSLALLLPLRDRQIAVLPLPGDMRDLPYSRHIGEQEDSVRIGGEEIPFARKRSSVSANITRQNALTRDSLDEDFHAPKAE